MGIVERLQRSVQPKDLEERKTEIALFAAKKGWIDFKRGYYAGDHSSPEDQQPFTSHVLFAFTKWQDTSGVAKARGVPYRSIDTEVAVGHLYHSFPEPEQLTSALQPQPYRLKIPSTGFRQELVTRTDLLTGAHLEEGSSVEDMCVQAIALGVGRFLEGVPETVDDPSRYLIDKSTVME